MVILLKNKISLANSESNYKVLPTHTHRCMLTYIHMYTYIHMHAHTESETQRWTVGLAVKEDLLLQRAWIWFSESIKMLTSIYNSSSKQSNIFSS